MRRIPGRVPAGHHLPAGGVRRDLVGSFCHFKEKNVPEEHRGEFGYDDVWTWVAIDAETKLVPTWLLGRRVAADAQEFIEDLALRLTHRVQLTTDGLRLYLDAVEGAFGAGARGWSLRGPALVAPVADQTRCRLRGGPNPYHLILVRSHMVPRPAAARRAMWQPPVG